MDSDAFLNNSVITTCAEFANTFKGFIVINQEVLIRVIFRFQLHSIIKLFFGNYLTLSILIHIRVPTYILRSLFLLKDLLRKSLRTESFYLFPIFFKWFLVNYLENASNTCFRSIFSWLLSAKWKSWIIIVSLNQKSFSPYKSLLSKLIINTLLQRFQYSWSVKSNDKINHQAAVSKTLTPPVLQPWLISIF